ARRCNVDRRAVDEERTLIGRRDNAIVTEINGADMIALRQHGHDNADILCRFRSRRRGCRSFGHAFGDRLLGKVEHLNRVSCLQKIERHRAAHVSDPDKSYSGHILLLVRKRFRRVSGTAMLGFPDDCCYYLWVGMMNSAPALMLSGQREVTVFTLV